MAELDGSCDSGSNPSPITAGSKVDSRRRAVPTQDVNGNDRHANGQFSRQSPTRAELWSMTISIMSLFVNAILGLIYYGQLREMRVSTIASTEATRLASDSLQYSASQFDRSMVQISSQTASQFRATQAAQSAAQTATDTLANQQTSFEIDQRPYLVTEAPQFITLPTVNNEVKVNITYKNIGRTPARRYVLHTSLFPFLGALGEEGRTRYQKRLTSAFAELRRRDQEGVAERLSNRSEQDIAPGATSFSTSLEKVVISQQDEPKLEEGTLFLLYVGVLSYTDAFNRSYKTEFCYSFFGTNPAMWHVCDSNNTIK